MKKIFKMLTATVFALFLFVSKFNHSSYLESYNPATLGLKQPPTIGVRVKINF